MTAPPLYLLLRHARAELAAETPQRLHTGHAPKLLDADGTTSTDEGGIGLPFTAEFHRLLALRERPGSDYLMRRSLQEVNDWCRTKHPEHVREHLSLCFILTKAAVVGDFYPAVPLHRDLVQHALQHAAQWRYEQERRTQVIEEARETVAERLRREHDLTHERTAWELTRVKYSILATWDDELDRRRREHERLGCADCPMLPRAA